MDKVIILNLTNVEIKGDTLDVGESYGVIYNLSKDIDEEVSVDYVDENEEETLAAGNYDNAAIFFSLSSIWRDGVREKLIKKVSKTLKADGYIYIWDINKRFGEVISDKIRAILPSGKVKAFEFKNINPICISNLDDTKKLLEGEFEIKEEKEWEDIFFIKGKKKE